MPFSLFLRERSETCVRARLLAYGIQPTSGSSRPSGSATGGYLKTVTSSGFVADYSGATASDSHGLPFARSPISIHTQTAANYREDGRKVKERLVSSAHSARLPPVNSKPVWLAVPAVLLLGSILLLAVWPWTAEWPQQPLFRALPVGLFVLAVFLGAAFTQTRITFVAAYAAIAVTLLDHAYFGAAGRGRGDATLMLASVMLPVLTATFYRLGERGLFTSHGATRLLATLLAIGFLLGLPAFGGFQSAVVSSVPPSLHTATGWWRLPGVGVLSLIVSLPLLVYPRKGESPLLGLLLVVAIVFLTAMLNFQSSLWRAVQQETALLLFGTLGAMALIAAVMEGVWRHMNIDELTELPGRRPFRHHLRCLGADYIMAVVDIDHFKRINDTHGHAVGDQVLKFLATELSRLAAARVYRYGGEEFAIVYEGDSYEQALNNLDDLRDAVGKRAFALRRPDRPDKKPGKTAPGAVQPAESLFLTVSVGAARAGARYATPQETLEAADEALYRAKEQGRNRVCYVE